jgi:predicted Holliday junction resolvase-like endonuclease
MTNMQLYLAIGLPIFAITTSLIISLLQITGIKTDLRDLRLDVKADAAALRTELRADTKGDIATFRAETKADIAALRADLKADIAGIKASIDLLTGKVYELMGNR